MGPLRRAAESRGLIPLSCFGGVPFRRSGRGKVQPCAKPSAFSFSKCLAPLIFPKPPRWHEKWGVGFSRGCLPAVLGKKLKTTPHRFLYVFYPKGHFWARILENTQCPRSRQTETQASALPPPSIRKGRGGFPKFIPCHNTMKEEKEGRRNAFII